MEIEKCSGHSTQTVNKNSISTTQIYVQENKYNVKYKPLCETIFFFDCDQRFSFSRLVKILKFQILNTLLSNNDNVSDSNELNNKIKQILDNDTAYDINNALRMGLKYFNIIKPSNTFSLIVSLLKLKDLYPSLLYIIIDSISMFYYVDIEEEANRKNLTEKKKIDNTLTSTMLYRQLNKLLKLLSQKYKITLFLTTRSYKKDYNYSNNLSNNNSQDILMENANDHLINSLYRSVLPNNNNCMEYFTGLQNNQLIFKNLFPDTSSHQEQSVYQEDLINFRLVISKHPKCLMEIPDELNNYTTGVFENKSKFLCCLNFPIKSNILEFEIDEYGICK